MQVRITDNFVANLQNIEAYWAASDFPLNYDRLLEELGSHVIPNLERYPDMGRKFSRHRAESIEALTRIEQLAIGESAIREYVLAEYLLLYLLTDMVYLLGIKHHKQLGYDFDRLWLNR